MIPVVDVFAGPGGLNEGFSSVKDAQGNNVFQTVASFEMESSAISTLTLRSAMRHCRLHNTATANLALSRFLNKEITFEELIEQTEFKSSFDQARKEVHQFELGPKTRPESDRIIKSALRPYSGHWVLIGGPPCQAYSLAGRSRRTHDSAFEDDHKHFLYREYLHIIRTHKPSIFVMENVKGLLSSTNRGIRMFDLIRNDLEQEFDSTSYKLHSMVISGSSEELDASDFLIRSEMYGVPQKRHRVIIVGIRNDAGVNAPEPLIPSPLMTVSDALDSLPKLRSTISRTPDPDGNLWNEVRDAMIGYVPSETIRLTRRKNLKPSSVASPTLIDGTLRKKFGQYYDFVRPDIQNSLPTWNHEVRGHMIQDLIRYGVLSAKSSLRGKSLKVRELTPDLWPKHKNITKDVVPFEDRFRVQVGNEPSTTIVSHIAKDGHYYIHPDPMQMRSLTVREAARLQTFPDDYVFLGNRTQQFTQVGNAVPPFLAKKIGERIAKAILENNENNQYLEE